MKSLNKRVVTYLSERYKNKLKEICLDREEKEALIVREIIKDYFDRTERKIQSQYSGVSETIKRGAFY